MSQPPPIPRPSRKTARLRHGRVSLPGARYFLTVCTQGRAPVLTQPDNATRIMQTFRTLNDGGCALHAATIMPDHAHLLLTLGPDLTLGQTMAKFKNLARDLGRAPWHWQADGFEHRLRPHELAEDYGFYIFMNPYRARLVSTNLVWPWWFCPDLAVFQFSSHLNGPAGIPSEWLGRAEETAQRVVSGE